MVTMVVQAVVMVIVVLAVRVVVLGRRAHIYDWLYLGQNRDGDGLIRW